MAAASDQRVFVGAEAFVDALRTDVAACTQSLRVQFSTFEGDDAGRVLADLLLDRSAAGVDVQVILDGYSEVIADDVYPFSIRGRKVLTTERRRRTELLDQLESHGIPIRRVNPAGRFHRYLLFRDHKKMVILDDRIAYVGGLNVSEHNYAWHDFMVRVEGPVVGDVRADFASTWSGETIALTERRDHGDYVLNHSPGRPTILDAALDLIAGARRQIVMESPYLCGDRIETALLAAAQRGVRVLLVTPLHPNHLHNRVWVRKLRRRLRHANIEVLGYPGSDGMTHAKLLVVDDKIAAFGSLNYQEIEAVAQKELNVFTRDPALVAELTAVAVADARASSSVPIPRTAFGWFTYRCIHWLVRAWTRRLLRRSAWRATYG
ncbi:MAG: phospholipase D-like domain-containing protein [Acidimicrobiia bacterium]